MDNFRDMDKFDSFLAVVLVVLAFCAASLAVYVVYDTWTGAPHCRVLEEKVEMCMTMLDDADKCLKLIK